MNEESKNALQLLTGASNLYDVSITELQQLAEEHPYFAAVHLLLLQKMQQVQDAGLQAQAHKTALFFPNQQWLHYFLFESNEIDKVAPVSENAHPVITSEKSVFNEAAVISSASGSILEEDEVIETRDSVSDIEDSNLITLPAEHILEGISEERNDFDEPEEFPLDEEELQQQSEPLPIDESNQKIANLLSGQVEEFSKPLARTTEIQIESEPFHTVDYFASQGIRFDDKREEENAFDRKVHKFTDWLRQMKRINPHPVDLGTEEEEETFILNIADSSNHAKEILTESMAEVLLKQGKNDKALEIYQKLSLLNPDKTTYFAGLIQNIK